MEHNLVDTKVKIICFDDSITFGHGVEGKGTSSGKTYPATLKNRIKEMLANK